MAPLILVGTNLLLYAKFSDFPQHGPAAEWLGLPGVWVPAPTDQHATVLGKLLLEANAAGNLVSDAHLAALSLEHGLEICSADADYARFPGVRWHNPLTGATAGVRER